MMTRHWMRAALVLWISAAGCATAGGRGTKPSLGKRTPPPMVVVANQNFLDMNLYVVQSGVRARLGMVTGLSTQRFRLPRDMNGDMADVRIFADPVGSSQGYLSPPVRVRPGQSLELTIGATLSLSSLAVW
ncbi:hypothetical protein [Longimicrobium sp.]|uniref:hypothetical protein n=1 Tax=Longimicrobium sp. TaxID=2029185 RepID=UPI002E369322|nr:hypothetical protein [Longimicrobium sp.]HEX6039702.1 hypothetical protein [Longimicrobium sp.]